MNNSEVARIRQQEEPAVFAGVNWLGAIRQHRNYLANPPIELRLFPTVVSVVGVAGVVGVVALQSSIGRVKTNSYLN